MTMNKKVAEAAGWYGMTAIVMAYAMVSFQAISSDGWLFQILNLTGSIGIIIISTIKKVRQSVILNIFWGIIATIALVRLIVKQ